MIMTTEFLEDHISGKVATEDGLNILAFERAAAIHIRIYDASLSSCIYIRCRDVTFLMACTRL